MFYSKSTGGFYLEEIHGDNMPKDCIEITDKAYQKLLDDQTKGKMIVADENGKPISASRPPLSDNQIIINKIKALEAQQTPRRLRESFIDPTWLNKLDKKISDLRAQLTGE
jgi:hypothetical protein